MVNTKRGYLKDDFKFFYLKDRENLRFEYHYHEFLKILIFISGNVTYLIEGKAYKLKPWDILLLNDDEVHRAIVDPDEIYERYIIWVNPHFIEKHNSIQSNLLTCFKTVSDRNNNLMRLSQWQLESIKHVLLQLEEACISNDFGNEILKNSLFLQLVVYINRLFLSPDTNSRPGDIKVDESISNILKYINDNLDKKLTIEILSSRFYMSRYYLMHRFKKQTGYTVHNYILQKKLMIASTLIKEGTPATEVSETCGFGDYSSFVRAFKKKFGVSPRNYYKSTVQTSKDGDNHFIHKQ